MAKNGLSEILGCTDEMANPADCGAPIDLCENGLNDKDKDDSTGGPIPL